MTRAGLYGVVSWTGAPFIDAGGNLIQQVVSDHARWPVVVLEATPLLHRPDIVDALRAANPTICILAFMDLEKAYFSPIHSLDPATDFTGQLYRAAADVPNGRGFLWSAKWGDLFDPLRLTGRPIPPEKSYSSFARNLASPECVRATAEVIIERVHKSGLFSGVFFDWAAHSVVWASSSDGDQINYSLAGFDPRIVVNAASGWDAAYRQGHRDVIRAMMDAAPSDSWIVNFNCGDDDPIEYAWESGQMLEDPAFDADPLAAIRAVRYREARCRHPGLNWFNTRPQGGATWDEHDPSIGFALACAYMTETGVATVSENGRPEPDGREKRWSPLYALNLGEPLTGPLPDGTGRLVRYFQGGIVRLDAVSKRGRFWRESEVAP